MHGPKDTNYIILVISFTPWHGCCNRVSLTKLLLSHYSKEITRHFMWCLLQWIEERVYQLKIKSIADFWHDKVSHFVELWMNVILIYISCSLCMVKNTPHKHVFDVNGRQDTSQQMLWKLLFLFLMNWLVSFFQFVNPFEYKANLALPIARVYLSFNGLQQVKYQTQSFVPL